MYISKSISIAEKDQIVKFIKRFGFGTVITAKDNLPIATHLPFIVRMEKDKLVLTSHFAIDNQHWKDISGQSVLIVFNELHAYGVGTLVTSTEKIMELLDATINHYNTRYQKQWDSLPVEYVEKMLNGIVVFDVEVTDLQKA